jgi:serine/threonine protein phosphatase PrpC
MNILRRLFGLDKPVPTVEEALEEAVVPESMSLPGVDAEIVISDDHADVSSEDVPFGATRQLPTLESTLTKTNRHIQYGHSTDVGMVRSNNQDAVLTFFASQGTVEDMPDFGLFVIADGMGGHHDGEKASAIASQVLAEQVTERIFLPMLGMGNGSSLEISEILCDAVKSSNKMVVETVPEGGTTITAATIIGDLAYVVHVGDSRAYLISQEFGMEQITRDHSLVQRLIELDQLTPEEAAQHPQKNVLYRAIGQSDSLEVDSMTRRLPSDSYLMLCSDGLWNMVPEETLLQVIFDAPTPQQACDLLVAVANEKGGSDNVSVILLRIPD